MTPDSATAGPTLGSATATEAELLFPAAERAVETFTFDVEQGRELLEAVSVADDRGELEPLSVDVLEHAFRDALVSTRPSKKQKRKKSPVQSAGVAPPIKKSRWSSSWFVSLLVHGAIITAISFITITTVEKAPEMLLTFSAGPEIPDEVNLDQFSNDGMEELANAEAQLASSVIQSSASIESELTAGQVLEDMSSGGLLGGSITEGLGLEGLSALGDGSNLFGTAGGNGSGGGGDGLPSGKQLTASFFGTKVDGRRILYIVDNSGGMQNGKLETLVDELLRSVESLRPEQQFYVIFYSDMLYPLFYPRPVERFVPATDGFKQRLRGWLDTVEFSMGNSVDEAILAGASIHPDAVYLLTDGDVNTTPDGRKMSALLDSRGRDFPIHTFGIGMSENNRAADNLRMVAEANRGKFRTVEVTRESRERAKQKARPYHNKQPGEVWGLNVGRGWGR